MRVEFGSIIRRNIGFIFDKVNWNSIDDIAKYDVDLIKLFNDVLCLEYGLNIMDISIIMRYYKSTDFEYKRVVYLHAAQTNNVKLFQWLDCRMKYYDHNEYNIKAWSDFDINGDIFTVAIMHNSIDIVKRAIALGYTYTRENAIQAINHHREEILKIIYDVTFPDSLSQYLKSSTYEELVESITYALLLNE